MEITVRSIDRIQSKTILGFTCSYGEGHAISSSNACDDLIGTTVSCELDINTKITVGKNAEYISNSVGRITRINNGLELIFKIESQDEDGMTFCRVSDDCLLMIESDNNKPLKVGDFLHLTVNLEDVGITIN